MTDLPENTDYSEDNNESTVEALELIIEQQPIELYKVLKMASLVNSGGQAKMLIAEGYVTVNGELELRKRKKIYHDDIVGFNEEYLYIFCDKPVQEQALKVNTAAKITNKTLKSEINKKKETPKNVKGRSNIKF